MTSKIAIRECGQPIRNRFDFQSNGALSGRYVGTDWTFPIGQLPDEWVKVLTSMRPLYVVFSYATPIAWWDEVAGWVVPDVKYSVTTSKHQGVVRRALPFANIKETL